MKENELANSIANKYYKARKDGLRWRNLCETMLSEMDAYNCPSEIKSQVRALLNSDKNDAVSDTTGSDSNSSADNQTSQIADKDWREQLKEAWRSFETHEDAIYFIEQYFTSTNGYDKLLQEHYELAEELSRLKEENERLRASYYKLWKKTSPPPNE